MIANDFAEIAKQMERLKKLEEEAQQQNAPAQAQTQDDEQNEQEDLMNMVDWF